MNNHYLYLYLESNINNITNELTVIDINQTLTTEVKKVLIYKIKLHNYWNLELGTKYTE
jgi:hypothetical protein